MKIQIVSTSDIMGGASRATYRLHRSLLKIGVESKMLVQYKMSNDYTVLGPQTNFQKAVAMVKPKIDQLPVKMYKHKIKTIFSPAWLPFSNVVRRINELNPDIVHLNWVAGGMLPIEDFTKLKKPIVWTLRDMWAFTGGCHYDNNCGKYEKECGVCPILKSDKKKDLSWKIFKRKKITYTKIDNLTIVGLSKWISECAKKSFLLKERQIINIPNPIDTEVFSPVNYKTARKILGLHLDKKLILFGAINATSDQRKGFKELSAAIDKITDENVELVIFGSSRPEHNHKLKFPVHYLGHFRDDISLKILYSAADVTIVPSLQENLSNVIIESMACGTPVVAFEIGGNSDMIDNKVNGYLASPSDIYDLAKGIKWVIDHPDYNKLSESARKKVLKEFGMIKVAERYKKLYEKILAEESLNNFSLSENKLF